MNTISAEIDMEIEENSLSEQTLNNNIESSEKLDIYSDFSSINDQSRVDPSGLSSGNKITGYFEPVPGENVISDDRDQAIVFNQEPVIDPQIGDILAYGYSNEFSPFSIKWEVVDILSPQEYVINYIYFNPDTLTEFVSDSYILNPYTRGFSASWDLFPYWLNPDELYLGAVVDVFYNGSNDGEVIGETTYSYYGEIVDVWILDDPREWQMYEKYYFVKDTGVLIATLDDSYNFYWEGTYISELSPSDEMHNLKQAVDFFEKNNTNFVIPILIHNTGHFAESSVTEVYVDGVFVTSRNLNLDGGEYFIWKVEWQPTSHGIYFVEVNTTVVTGETYIIDNYYSIDFSTYPPVQYFMYSTPFIWYDTYHSGQSLGLAGDDVCKSINLQFDFFFYDHFFSTIYIDSNGVLSFLELDSLTWNRWGIPTDWYNYIIAPFWDDLYASNNVYYRSTPDYFAVTYWYYITTSPGYFPVGTFEVVIHANGDIVFQYHYIEYDPGSIVGLSYGRDLSYYSLYTPSLDGASDFAILFSPSPYTSFFEVNAYNSISLDPLANAQVNIYDEADNLLKTGLTNIDGFYKVVAVPVGTYRIEVVADGYIPESQIEFVDMHEGNYLYFHLDPLPIREVLILSPTEGQTVEGGVVYIEFATSNTNDVVLVDMFVDDVWVANVTSLYSEHISVPIFENGTNVIRLEFLWADTSNAIVEISIESVDVIPLYVLEDGDYFILTVEFPDVELFIEQTLTFIWYSEFEINVTSTMRTYDASNTTQDQMQYYVRVNILNGYITDSDIPGFFYSNFALFNRITNETNVGDPFISSAWSDIVFIDGSMVWRSNEVWTITLMGGILLYIDKESGLMVYEELPASVNGPGFGFVQTNIYELDYDPYLLSEADYSYEYGTTGHLLTWHAYDEDPAIYEIYKDGELVETDTWSSGVPISCIIDDLAVGTYNYTVVVIDNKGNSVSDTVIVTVTAVIAEYNSLLKLLFLPTIICITLVLILKKRKILSTK
ncbi:MAG: carboxypeptidase regulatory-like domain-containing protein [Candidatus Heimdallarchaeota archaeon]|nr:carboxypeptidase regulatory-like domain-containing protein [Candidatus Heimdallarchaeota archaeon]